jgi:hypothetical protein
MKRKATWSLFVVAGIAITAWILLADAPNANQAADTPQPLDPATAGMRVYIDPVTGEFLQEPPQPLVTEAVKDIHDPFSTSTEGLKEVPAPVGGGVMVDLKGRFQQIVSATIDDSGKVKAVCDRHEPEATSSSDSEKE